MLKLNRRQIQAMDTLAFDRFVARMVRHIQVFFPERYLHDDDRAMQAMVRGVVEKARRYGINGKDDVCRFLNLCMLLGADFDENPQHVWVQEILSNPFYQAGSTRMAMLDDAAQRVLGSSEQLP